MYLRKISILTFIFTIFTNISYAQTQRDNYKLGYSDGCYSSKNSFRQDSNLYSNNQLYIKGWDSGERQCGDKNSNSHKSHKSHTTHNSNSNYNNTHTSTHTTTHTNSHTNGHTNHRGGVGRTYNLGYQDGCRSAHGRFSRDYQRYRHNRNYRAGWKDGHRACRRVYNYGDRDIYRVGYEDGCETARYRFIRDELLYRENIRYQKGWNNGEFRCR